MARRTAALVVTWLIAAAAPSTAAATEAGAYAGTSASEISVSKRGTAITSFSVGCFQTDLGGRTVQTGSIYLGAKKRVPISGAGRFDYAGSAYLRHISASPGTRVRATIKGSFSGDRARGRVSIVTEVGAWQCLPRTFSARHRKPVRVVGGA